MILIFVFRAGRQGTVVAGPSARICKNRLAPLNKPASPKKSPAALKHIACVLLGFIVADTAADTLEV